MTGVYVDVIVLQPLGPENTELLLILLRSGSTEEETKSEEKGLAELALAQFMSAGVRSGLWLQSQSSALGRWGLNFDDLYMHAARVASRSITMPRHLLGKVVTTVAGYV